MRAQNNFPQFTVVLIQQCVKAGGSFSLSIDFTLAPLFDLFQRLNFHLESMWLETFIKTDDQVCVVIQMNKSANKKQCHKALLVRSPNAAIKIVGLLCALCVIWCLGVWGNICVKWIPLKDDKHQLWLPQPLEFRLISKKNGRQQQQFQRTVNKWPIASSLWDWADNTQRSILEPVTVVFLPGPKKQVLSLFLRRSNVE